MNEKEKQELVDEFAREVAASYFHEESEIDFKRLTAVIKSKMEMIILPFIP